MITEIIALMGYLVESCTGVTLEIYEDYHGQENEIVPFLTEDPVNHIEDFTKFDAQDIIFEEFDPPKHLEVDPKAWKLSLPTLKKSLWDCLKSLLLIQVVAGTLIGLVAIAIVFLDFSTVEWCYDDNWNTVPKSVQHLRVTAEFIEAFVIQLWDFCFLLAVFPFSLIRDLHLLPLNLLASFFDVVYRLNLQMYGIYKNSWVLIPLNVLFSLVVLMNHLLVSRHFCPGSCIKTAKLFFILSSQFLLGIPVAFFLVYKLFPFYVQQVDEEMKVLIAAVCPVFSVIPKVVSRLGAQTLKGVIHPGTAYVLSSLIYGTSAVVFRVMQAELTSIDLFIALGIAHAIIDLLERITITMRDQIWEYLYRFVLRKRSISPKYRTPRSRRFVADLSIQIMMQEATALVTALGFATLYQAFYSEPKPFINSQLIVDFFTRAAIGLSIELFFNTISLLIQTRVMNVAVNRVWKKKWRYHMIVNAFVVWFAVLYFSQHLFVVVKNNYDRSNEHPRIKYNCSFPSFL